MNKQIFLLPAVLRGLALAACLSHLASGFATDIPAEPLLKAASEFSKWTVTFTYQQDPKTGASGGASHQLRQMVVTKTRDIVREEFVDAKGGRTEVWHVGNVQYRKEPNQNFWTESSPAGMGNHIGDPNHRPLPANGFRGWDWIGRESFAGIVDVDKTPCLVFIPQSGTPMHFSSENADKLAAQPRVALVDEKTRFPREMRSGAMLQKIQFQDAPTTMQVLPADLTQQLKQGEEGRQRLFQPAARPY